MNKKIFGIIFILAATLVLTGAGCANNKTVTPEPSGDGTQTGDVPATGQTDTAKEGDIGKMNDDLYIEIQAQMMYQVSRDDLYIAWVNGGYEKYLASKGVTEKQLEAYGEKILNDPNTNRPTEITDKIGQRFEKLSK